MCHSSLVSTQFTKENVCDVRIIQLYFFSRNGSIINIIDAKFTTNPSSEQVASVLIGAAQTITAFDIEISSISVNGIGKICQHVDLELRCVCVWLSVVSIDF